jgi:quercetin dioxygenase-like cupin family protein
MTVSSSRRTSKSVLPAAPTIRGVVTNEDLTRRDGGPKSYAPRLTYEGECASERRRHVGAVLLTQLGLRVLALSVNRWCRAGAATAREVDALREPTRTDPDKYTVVFENDRVRVLEYRDAPGAKTRPHDHPDSVMVMLSGFDRRLTVRDQSRDVHLETGDIRWLQAQTHSGENIGATSTHVIFVELKGERERSGRPTLGPTT